MNATYKGMGPVVMVLITMISGCQSSTLFKRIKAPDSGIEFNNQMTETSEINALKQVNVYNGGGVGAGDFNNDGLQDLYFTGNMVPNKLYINRGGFRFTDVTEVSHVNGEGKWCRGVSVVDINNDGRPDIYIAASMSKTAAQRENLLYVNQGNNKDGIPVFKQMAAEYGLNDTTHTTMSHFFDYDNDGDLDVYLVVNEQVSKENQNVFRPLKTDGSHPSTGRLYRNNWDSTLHHGVYKDISREAGILTEGYGHSAIVSDINLDGWKDIYVTNDFISNNILYVNNQDGTFTDRSKEYFKQTSTFAMGVDMQDLNNDGLLDVIELDMNPRDNYRKKMMLAPNSYQMIQNFEKFNYQFQYSRNTIQLNQGPRILAHDSIGAPVFSQVGFLYGMAETDWSWTPMVNDFDNDGFRDLIITNGFPKDVTDHDFMVYRSKASKVASQDEILQQVPEVSINNYGFKNIAGNSFEESTEKWGLEEPCFSNGAVYADLDNDGDMDLIINNINKEAFIYENNIKKENAQYLNIKLKGPSLNMNGFGTWIKIYYDNGKQQVYEHTPYRGYLSSVQDIAHFGLGNSSTVDSIIVVWPDNKKEVILKASAGQTIQVDIKNAGTTTSFDKPVFAKGNLFSEVSDSLNIKYIHEENDYVDFNVQKLLPHKLSEYTPALAVGDIDGNGLEDMICGGNSKNPAVLFFQQENGLFKKSYLFSSVPSEPHPYGKYGIQTEFDFRDSGLLLFDADGDGDLDLYISSGGFEHDPNSVAYQDRFYVNDGKGNFTEDKSALAQNFTSKFCVRAADYDKDGDLDVFVAGRMEPWRYPVPVSSFIYRNDSEKGKIKFTDVTSEIAPSLQEIGLICDAVFTDFNNDGWQDMILAGEWMPVTFLKNEKGHFENVSAGSGVNEYKGWWNSIVSADFDNDGDIDYVIGNLGRNTLFQANNEYPMHITASYFDNNFSYDALMSLYFPISQTKKEKKEFPVHQLDDVIKQMVSLRPRFTNYRTYAAATLEDMFSPEQMSEALRLSANTMSSSYLRNDGAGKFSLSLLPPEAQFSLLNGMVANDFDGDGNEDLVVSANDFGTDVSVGRYDAMNGLFLKGDGKGNFKPLSILQSGIYIPGNGKALVQFISKNGTLYIAASQHKGSLKLFRSKKTQRSLPLQPMDNAVTIRYADGRSQKKEIGYGSSFLSQSGRFILLNDNMTYIEITDYKGRTRKVPLK